MGERRVDGAFLVDLPHADPHVAGVAELGTPAVVIGHPGEAGPLPAVWSDDAAALREAVSYLTVLGHRAVARGPGLPELVHTRMRDTAHREVCAELGLGEPLVIRTDYTGEEGAHATRRPITGPRRPTAVVYDHDMMAVTGLSVARGMGVDVPRDLSLVAWDDSRPSRVVHPPVTALSRDIPAYGAPAARILLARIATGEPLASHQHETARLMPRGSTPRPGAEGVDGG